MRSHVCQRHRSSLKSSDHPRSAPDTAGYLGRQDTPTPERRSLIFQEHQQRHQRSRMQRPPFRGYAQDPSYAFALAPPAVQAEEETPRISYIDPFSPDALCRKLLSTLTAHRQSECRISRGSPHARQSHGLPRGHVSMNHVLLTSDHTTLPTPRLASPTHTRGIPRAPCCRCDSYASLYIPAALCCVSLLHTFPPHRYTAIYHHPYNARMTHYAAATYSTIPPPVYRRSTPVDRIIRPNIRTTIHCSCFPPTAGLHSCTIRWTGIIRCTVYKSIYGAQQSHCMQTWGIRCFLIIRCTV